MIGLVTCVIVVITTIIIGFCLKKEDKKYAKIVISNGSATVEWSFYVIQDTDILKMAKAKEIESPKPNDEGGTIKYKYYFEGLKEGTTKIYVVWSSFYEVRIKEAYEVKVDEKLNASIREVDKPVQSLICIPVEEECDYNISNNDILKCLGYYENHTGKGYIVEGCKEGDTDISFNTSDGIEEYKINVDKGLNVSYQNKK